MRMLRLCEPHTGSVIIVARGCSLFVTSSVVRVSRRMGWCWARVPVVFCSIFSSFEASTRWLMLLGFLVTCCFIKMDVPCAWTLVWPFEADSGFPPGCSYPLELMGEVVHPFLHLRACFARMDTSFSIRC